jgi:hypothetical protein
MSELLKQITLLESLVEELKVMRLAKVTKKAGWTDGTNLGVLVALCTSDPSESEKASSLDPRIVKAYAHLFRAHCLFSKNFDETCLMRFFLDCEKFLSRLSDLTDVLESISRVFPTLVGLLSDYMKMPSPSPETALQSLSTLLRCSKEQREHLETFNQTSVSPDFVIVMTHILDIQDRLIRGLITRIQNAVYV